MYQFVLHLISVQKWTNFGDLCKILTNYISKRVKNLLFEDWQPEKDNYQNACELVLLQAFLQLTACLLK
jgi:hypothetical protein